MKRWYAVQHGDNFESDCGSTVKREALKMAHQLAKEYPGEEIRICVCAAGDDFCTEEIIVREGTH